MLRFEDVKKILPPNVHIGGYANTEVNTSWMTAVMPFLEANTLASPIQAAEGVGGPDNLPIYQTAVPTFMCPSDGYSPVNGQQIGPYTGAAAPTASGGARRNWPTPITKRGGANWCSGDFIISQSTGRFAGNCDGLDHGNGILCRTWGPVITTHLREITDGTSHTFAVGESIA